MEILILVLLIGPGIAYVAYCRVCLLPRFRSRFHHVLTQQGFNLKYELIGREFLKRELADHGPSVRRLSSTYCRAYHKTAACLLGVVGFWMFVVLPVLAYLAHELLGVAIRW